MQAPIFIPTQCPQRSPSLELAKIEVAARSDDATIAHEAQEILEQYHKREEMPLLLVIAIIAFFSLAFVMMLRMVWLLFKEGV